MSEHGAALQTYNLELVKCLEELKIKRKIVQDIVSRQEQEKDALESNIQGLQQRLDALTASLQQNKDLYESYDKTIVDTENGFQKLLESSQTLLNLAQMEANNLETCVEKRLISVNQDNM